MSEANGSWASEAESNKRPRGTKTAARGARIIERLAAGLSIAEAAGPEGISPRRARTLVAETVARRGFDP
jgi:hypothetical protein